MPRSFLTALVRASRATCCHLCVRYAAAAPLIAGWLACTTQKPGDVVAPAGDAAIDTGDDPTGVEITSDAAPRPSTVAPAHLRLWLTADNGVTCTAGRVTRWADHSGNSDDAVLSSGQVGPRCGSTPPLHPVNGIDLPYFAAQAVSDGSLANVVDGTLDVDLGFLTGSDYTIFVVERRWADTQSGAVLGTTVPSGVEDAGLNAWCHPNPRNTALAFGYAYRNGSVQLALSQGCTGGIFAAVSSVPTPPPIALSEETFSLDRTRGHEIWSSGTPVGTDYDPTPLAYSGGGAIGRADFATTGLGLDNRFNGDVAEVIVYDAALQDIDRINVEKYLRTHWRY